MSDRKTSGLPFDGDDAAEQALWRELGELPEEQPAAGLRRRFYTELDQMSVPGPLERLRGWLGFAGNAGWITAAACLLLGIGAGQLLPREAGDDGQRLAALEQNVQLLNRELILGRLEDDDAASRLRGVVDARSSAATDGEIARALLLRATEDRVSSVRTAAIEALGPSFASGTIGGSELMTLLQQAESPLVQLALVDLVLRYGDAEQLGQLIELADSGRLHADLVEHVRKSIRGDTV